MNVLNIPATSINVLNTPVNFRENFGDASATSRERVHGRLRSNIEMASILCNAGRRYNLYIRSHLRRKSSFDVKENKIRELEASLKSSLEKCNAERQGRIRAQQALRKSLVQIKSDNLEWTSYPMAPIAIAQSCFSTRDQRAHGF
ncbi:hypothetical protein HYC85_003876 [Camellia sinensis]|uniref:Uncharacterized protein n=1 Tax=Camellia sinensis TaxID=4442 RepID=A0A7J7HWM6_CAMSI|nr:hypothetical protein HYC85_003876 [Camellia sinensis]